MFDGLNRLPALRIVSEIQRGASMKLGDDTRALLEANRALRAEVRQVRLRSRPVGRSGERGTTRRSQL